MKEIDKDIREKRNKQYNDWARKRPAFICLSILVFIGITMGIYDVYSIRHWWKAVVYILSISVIGGSLFFLLRFFLRDMSKIYPRMILFCDRLKPTTRLLYSTDKTFSEENKKDIRMKIKAKKNIDLGKFRDKTYHNKNYVKRVDEAVSWLLEVTRFDDILFEHNCMYGFYRNFTAALTIDAILVFVLAAVNTWAKPLPFGNSLGLIGIVLLLITVFTTMLSYSNGKTYAKRLYNVFLSLNDDDAGNY